MMSLFQLDYVRCLRAALLCAVGLAAVSPASAAIIVNDTWQDGERYGPAGPLFVPAPPPYAENNGVVGTDADGDGDLESAWFRGGAGALDPAGNGGPLRLTQDSASSSSITTYFTNEGSEVNLANAGDSITVTWEFNVDGAVGANTSQGFRVALVNSPAASRLVANGSPGSAAYTGYSLFMNMNSSFSHSRPFELMERNVASGDLLSAAAAWVGLANDGTNGNTGYAPGNTYSLTMTMTRTAANELQIDTSIVGGNLNGDGSLAVSFTDPTPNSFAFDTFQFRPDGNDVSYNVINTSLFRVEYTQIPEPATLSLLGLAGLAVVGMARRRR